MIRASFACLVLVCVSACGVDGPGSGSGLAGAYELSTVDGRAVPCCTRTDSATGVSTTALSGRLTLSAAAPETFVNTPAGVALPSSCVYEVPNGAHIHADTVFRADGSWYLLAPCGRGTYALSLSEQVDSAGRTDTTTLNYSGRYSWSDGGDSAVDLVGSFSGSFARGSRGVSLSLQTPHFGIYQGPPEPTYVFVSGP
ncbi:MAG TPA: hypothetical protein VFT41_13145 [Gemmatimonadaceae bacterium]|nr:hypothetical protein [Gemmatimonadaceae bacterium]